MICRFVAAPVALFTAVCLSMPLALSAQDEGPATVRIVVRTQAKGDAAAPVLKPSDLKLEFDGRSTPITRLMQLGTAGAPVEVALVIDDSLRGSFGTQLQDVERFVDSTVAPQVAMGVGYMRNGAVDFPNGFSTEAEQVKKSIRLPIAVGGISGSPYFCLQDLVKHWPTRTNAAHVVLMITNGIDYYNGSVSPLNQNSPYVDAATTDAQRANVPVYSIYYGRRDFSAALPSLSGQSYLSEVAEGTGGQMFNQGQINPPSLTPYFNQFTRSLRESYLLSFQTGARKMQRIKLSTKVPGVKLHVQQQAGNEDRSRG